MTLGKKLYVSVISSFVIFAAIMILFQQSRERHYRQDAINAKLQEYNFRINCALAKDSTYASASHALLSAVGNEDLRITILSDDGTVLYDSKDSLPSKMENHSDREEIKEALKNLSGSDYDRVSSTFNKKYFYSATYFPSDKLIVRTSLPYNSEMESLLRGDTHYLLYALCVLAFLTTILARFINRFSVNISKLQKFAQRIASKDVPSDDEIETFPDDELGEIASRIAKLYKDLQETQHQQETLKRQLTQNIAHELKTPVASIHGYIETLLTNPNIDEATYKQFMERCYAQTNRLSSLLQDISTLNRLDDASTEHTFEQLDISKIVNNIQKETALQLAQKEMKFDNGLPEKIEIQGNMSLIYSIFRNLTDNAIAYAGQGTTISLRARETQQSWFFEFSDNGIGVNCEHLNRLFERFYRVDKGRSRAQGGTGLGLAIVKNAVNLHGGSIKVNNRRGGGLIFMFSLRKRQEK